MDEETKRLTEEKANAAYQKASHRLRVAIMEAEEAFVVLCRYTRDTMPGEGAEVGVGR